MTRWETRQNITAPTDFYRTLGVAAQLEATAPAPAPQQQPAPPAPPAPQPPAEPLAEIEQRRLDKVAANAAMRAALGLCGASELGGNDDAPDICARHGHAKSLGNVSNGCAGPFKRSREDPLKASLPSSTLNTCLEDSTAPESRLRAAGVVS